MPTLTSFPLLNQRVKKYHSDYQLETPGEAFGWVVLETVLNLNADEIVEAIVDEGMDGGIDGIHLTDTDIHLFTYTYTESFENAASNFPQNKLDNLVVTVQKIITRSLGVNDVNPALWEKVQGIWGIFNEGVPNFHFHVCTNKKHPTDAAKRRFEESLKPFRLVNFQYASLEDMVDMILERRRRPVDGEITFINTSHFPKSDGPLKATVAAVSATDLIELIKDPEDDERINDDIFNDNVRVDLGLRNAINSGIYESALASDNYEFWYLNNGITLVCDECSYLPNSRSPKVTLKNVQIVNGGQTARTIFHASLKDLERLKAVDVLVRIIETRDRSISDKISETANRQTPVRTRDLRANDRIQKKVEEEFLSLGYYYERKKNQYADQPANRRLDAEVVGQVSLAYYLDLPSEAKNQKAIVFGDKYDEIFDDQATTAVKLLAPVLLYKPIEEMKREIQRKKRKKQHVTDEEAFTSLATFHILNAMKVVAEQETLNLEKLEDTHVARQKAIVLIGEVVKQEMQARRELYTHDRFFKQRETNLIIREHVLRAYGHGVPTSQSST